MQILLRNVLICLAAALVIVWVHARRKGRPVATLYHAFVVSLLMMMTCVFSLTGVSPISGFHTDVRLDEINWTPFVGMLDILRDGWSCYSVSNILGNILLFLPLGFLAPVVSPRLGRFWKTALLGLGVSLWIECTQLFLTRGTDVDDLILNTAGAMLGFALYALCRRVFPRLAEGLRAEAEASSGTLLLALCLLVPYAVCVAGGFYDRFVYFSS